MALQIRTFPAGPIETNAYLVADDATGDALIVDAPAGVTDEVVAAAREAGWRVGLIVITHTHWDHVADAATLRTATGVELAAHPLAVEPLARPASLLGDELPVPVAPVATDRLLNDGDTVTLGNHTLRVMHLPGHDPSHIVLVGEAERVFLGGDVLFPGGHGRTDIPGADQAAMNRQPAPPA